MYERVQSYLFNVPLLLLTGLELQIKFAKSKSEFYVLRSKVDTGAVYIFLDAAKHVRLVRPSPTMRLAHAKAWKR
jgi:hypothetical protein